MTDTTNPMARYANFHPMRSVEKLRGTLDKLAHLPSDTAVFLVLDDGNEPTSYAPATELQVTHWNGYERCAATDDDAELAPFFIYPAQHPEGVASGGTFHPVATLAALRDTVAALRDNPTFHRTEDASNDEDSFTIVSELQVAWWDGSVQVGEPGDGVKQALFII
ncbi:hypothetical protein [Nonomuraea sp. NPDC050202]|uniref:hypothetical protein n=1 Tax=Nonomuraea sp. NPDC050202 TaxID=3155035 RepID=UPI0033D4DA9C